jgi:hypothetical protein
MIDAMSGTDVHQHLWPEELLALLGRRRRPPHLRREGSDWVVRLRGEPEAVVDLTAHRPARRLESLAADGLGRALVCNSSPLGIEALPGDEADPLIRAFNDGALALPPAFGTWGALVLDPPDHEAVDDLLDRGAAGVSLPAGAVADRDGLDRVRLVLDRLESRSAPLLVHPGPAPWTVAGPGSDDGPAWWAGLTSYVAQMNSAWHAFAAWGRRAHPELRVVFAMLAGGAPLHSERLAARGGPAAAATDPLTFYDTSSYGVRALDATVRVVGVDQLVHGSDRPVVDPPATQLLGAAAQQAMRGRNVERLLAPRLQAVAA